MDRRDYNQDDQSSSLQKNRTGGHKKGKEAVSNTTKALHIKQKIHSFMDSIEQPAKNLGKFVLWASPLILASLEIRHELHSHGHKRKLMKLELEKTQAELRLEKEKSKGLEPGECEPEGREAVEGAAGSSTNAESSKLKRLRTMIGRSYSSLSGTERQLGEDAREEPNRTVFLRKPYQDRRSPRKRVRFLSQSNSDLGPGIESLYYRRTVTYR